MQLFRWHPWFSSLTKQALNQSKLAFQTHDHLSKVNCPCVILHADDDYTVPYIHGKQLLKVGLAARENHRKSKELLHFTIDMISFPYAIANITLRRSSICNKGRKLS